MIILKVEVRADGVHISGYVNAVMRESKPVVTKNNGVVNEIIEEKVFQRALEKSMNVTAQLDHREDRVIADTSNGTLELREDNIGLHAELRTSDKEVVENASKLSGWSFGFRNPTEEIEQRADKYPLRRITSLDIDHVALLLHKSPAYSATSIELRAEQEEVIETRSTEENVDFVDTSVETPSTEKEDLNYKMNNRLLEIKHNI